MTPSDRSRSLTDRLRFAASEQGVDPGRLRRQLVFQRILVRLAGDGTWVLKGGFCLEVRLGLVSRATKDLDLAFRGGDPFDDALDVQDLLADALQAPIDDGFAFAVERPRPIAASELGQPGWRVSVRASVEGRPFETVKLDVVARSEEIAGGTEPLPVRPVLRLPEFDAITVEAVDIAQHAAEKVHAYARVYAYDRPSSRMKDLVDLVLMIEAGLLEPGAWGERLVHVFATRDGAEPPRELPAPPPGWRSDYVVMSQDLGLAASDLAAAAALVASLYGRAIAEVDQTSRMGTE